MLDGKITIFRELNKEINGEHRKMDEVEVIKEIHKCLQNYPKEENTYIVLGNCLYNYPHMVDAFLPRLVEEGRYVVNQLWCLLIVAQILEAEFSNENRSGKETAEMMEEVVQVSCKIVRMMVEEVRGHVRCSDNENQMQEYFL